MAIAAYTPTIFINDTSPPMDETNMNKPEQGIKTVTDETISLGLRVTDLETTVISLAYHYLSGGSAGVTISNVWLDVANYATSSGVVMSGNPVTGETLVPTSGDYRETINLSIGFDDTLLTTPILSIRVVGDIAFVGETVSIGIPNNSTIATIFPSIIVPLVATENYKLQIMSDIDLTTVIYQMAYFELEAKL